MDIAANSEPATLLRKTASMWQWIVAHAYDRSNCDREVQLVTDFLKHLCVPMRHLSTYLLWLVVFYFSDVLINITAVLIACAPEGPATLH